MNSEPENSTRSAGDDPLDQLLNEARWPTATPVREAQFAQRWQEVWRLQRRHERLAFRSTVLGIAATLLVAATVDWSWWHRAGKPVSQPVAIKQPAAASGHGKDAPVAKDTRVPRTALRPMSPSPPVQALAHSSTRAVLPTDVAEEQVFSRPPNELEEMFVAALVRRGSERKRTVSRRLPAEASPILEPANLRVVGSSGPRTKSAIVKTAKDAAQAAVARLVADPKANPAQVAESLRSAASENETRLLAILANSRPPEQIAAVRLLAEIGSPGAVPDLLHAGADPSLRVAVIGALSRIADSATINQLVQEETSKDLQRLLLAALLGHGDGDALNLYLSYIVNESTTETALAAAESVQSPPMDLLFSELQSPSELERLAAARVLGRIDGPATTERLIAMLDEGSSRQEACVALLSSRGQEATNFVKNARTNPALATLLQAASVLVSNNTQPRS
jgi:HEAT repeat protein